MLSFWEQKAASTVVILDSPCGFPIFLLFVARQRNDRFYMQCLREQIHWLDAAYAVAAFVE